MENNQYQFICEFPSCGMHYEFKQSLSRHQRTKHVGWLKPDKYIKGEGGFPCNVCSKDYSSKETLRKHKCKAISKVQQSLFGQEQSRPYEVPNNHQNNEQQQMEIQSNSSQNVHIMDYDEGVEEPIQQQQQNAQSQICAKMQDIALSPRATNYMEIALSPRSSNSNNNSAKKFSPKILIDNRQLVDANIQTEQVQNLDNVLKLELQKLRVQFKAMQHHCPLCNRDCTQSQHTHKVTKLLAAKKPQQKGFLDSLRSGQRQLAQFGFNAGVQAISRAIQTNAPQSVQLTPNQFVRKRDKKWSDKQDGATDTTMFQQRKDYIQKNLHQQQHFQEINALVAGGNVKETIIANSLALCNSILCYCGGNPQCEHYVSRQASGGNITIQQQIEDEAKRRERIFPSSDTNVQNKNYQISEDSLKRLDPGQFLNDEIINAWVTLLNDIGSVNQKHYFVNTYFYPKIQTQKISDFDSVLKGLKKKLINLPSFDTVFVPINSKIHGSQDFHWYLVVIQMKYYTFSVLDSYRGLQMVESYDKVTQTLEAFVHHICKENSQHWVVAETNSPHQGNIYDCGVCMCKNMELIVTGVKTDYRWDSDQSKLYRNYIRVCLDTGELKTEKNVDLLTHNCNDVMVPRIKELGFIPTADQFFLDKMYEQPFVIRRFTKQETKLTKDIVHKELEQISTKNSCIMGSAYTNNELGSNKISYKDYLRLPPGRTALEVPVASIKPRILKGYDPSFMDVQKQEKDWVVVFLQKGGHTIGDKSQLPFLQDVYNITQLHRDDFIDGLPVCSWMVQLQGRKRWYLLPPNLPNEFEQKQSPTFTSIDILTECLQHGLLCTELNEGDLLYFPGDWFHEVHNLDPDVLSIAGGPKWPSKRNRLCQIDKITGKRTFKQFNAEHAEAFNRLNMKLDTVCMVQQQNNKKLIEQHYSISISCGDNPVQLLQAASVSDPGTQEVFDIITEYDGDESVFRDLDNWRDDESVWNSIYSRCGDIKKQRKLHDDVTKAISELTQKIQAMELNQKNMYGKLSQVVRRLDQTDDALDAFLSGELKRMGYRNISVVGRGGFGRVYKGKYRESQVWEAIKISTQVRTSLDSEINFLQKTKGELNSRFLVTINRQLFVGDKQAFTMPYFPYNLCELASRIKFNANQKRHIIWGVLRGVLAGHQQKRAHTDIKLQNILMTEKYVPQVSDWANDGVTEKYIPPEYFIMKDYDKFLADSWALGIVIFQLLENGSFPFDKDWQNKLKQQLKSGCPASNEIISLQFSQQTPLLARSLISSLLETDVNKRLHVKDVVNHAWFKGISLFGSQCFDFKSLGEEIISMTTNNKEEQKEKRVPQGLNIPYWSLVSFVCSVGGVASLNEVKQQFVLVIADTVIVEHLKQLCERSDQLTFDNNCVCYCSSQQKEVMCRLQNEAKLGRHLDQIPSDLEGSSGGSNSHPSPQKQDDNFSMAGDVQMALQDESLPNVKLDLDERFKSVIDLEKKWKRKTSGKKGAVNCVQCGAKRQYRKASGNTFIVMNGLQNHCNGIEIKK